MLLFWLAWVFGHTRDLGWLEIGVFGAGWVLVLEALVLTPGIVEVTWVGAHGQFKGRGWLFGRVRSVWKWRLTPGGKVLCCFFFNPRLSALAGFSSSLRSDCNGISRVWCIKNVWNLSSDELEMCIKWIKQLKTSAWGPLCRVHVG